MLISTDHHKLKFHSNHREYENNAEREGKKTNKQIAFNVEVQMSLCKSFSTIVNHYFHHRRLSFMEKQNTTRLESFDCAYQLHKNFLSIRTIL